MFHHVIVVLALRNIASVTDGVASPILGSQSADVWKPKSTASKQEATQAKEANPSMKCKYHINIMQILKYSRCLK